MTHPQGVRERGRTVGVVTNPTKALWPLCVVVEVLLLASVLTVVIAQGCVKNETQLAATERDCAKTCSTSDDCRRNRQCVCDDICGLSCIKTFLVDYCDEIPEEDGISLTYVPTNRTFHSQVTATCSSTYQYESGDQVRTCRGDGDWSGDTYTCSQVTCGTPPEVPLAHVHPDDVKDVYVAFDWLYYQCDYGHYRLNLAAIQCLFTGVWSEPQIECRPKTCPYPHLDNGYYEGDLRFGSTVEMKCNTGYELAGLPYRTCQGDQSWSGFEPSCNVVVCPELSDPTNGRIRGRVFTYGEQVYYECNDGYVVDGSPNRQCQADGTWSGVPTTCRDINCGEPMADYSPNWPDVHILIGGRRQGNTYAYRDVVYYVCNSGHRLHGSASSHCTDEERWSHPVPKCIETQPPQIIKSPPNVEVNTEPGKSQGNATWSDPTAGDNSGYVAVTSDHKSGDLFPIGDTTVTVTAIDPSGNTDTAAFVVTVTDIEPPKFTFIPPNVTVDNAPSKNTGIATWRDPTASDNSGSVTVTPKYKSGSMFPIGKTTVVFTASDLSGNTVTDQIVVTVDDIEPPVFKSPNNIVAVVDTGKDTAVVTWNTQVKDNNQVLNDTCDRASGEVFSIGVITVMCTAFDVSGNKATHSFSITVEESPPTTTILPTTTTAVIKTGPPVSTAKNTDKTIYIFEVYANLNSSSTQIELIIQRKGNVAQADQLCVMLTEGVLTQRPKLIDETQEKWTESCQVQVCIQFDALQAEGDLEIDIGPCIKWAEEASDKNYKEIEELMEWLRVQFMKSNLAEVEFGDAIGINYDVVECPPLDQGDIFIHGTKVHYSCSTFRYVKGTPVKECLSDGTWTGDDIVVCEMNSGKVAVTVVVPVLIILAIIALIAGYFKWNGRDKYGAVTPVSTTEEVKVPPVGENGEVKVPLTDTESTV